MSHAEQVDLSTLSDDELTKLERDIVRKYMQGISWFMVLWPFVNVTCWFALWPLVFIGYLPVWIGFLIACANVTLAYLPSHEAQHDIYARPGEPLRWLNQFIGHFSVIPLAYSYRMLRETHMEHHKNTNHPELDPDYDYNHEKTGWGSIMNTIQSFQPDSKSAKSYVETMQRLDTPAAQLALRDQMIWTFVQYGFLFTCAYHGYALEALLLWWLPLKIGIIYLRFYLSWAPHFPGNEMGRYKDTRGFKSWLGSFSSLAMTAHIIHHLHPRIPLDRTPAALREMRPILEARKCRLDG